MPNQTIQQLLADITRIWIECDECLFEKYYEKALEANYYNHHLTYTDLYNRLQFLKINHKQRKLEILDTVIEPKKIAARFRYYAIDENNEIINNEFVAIYHLNDQQKIIRAWAFANQPVNYVTD